MILTNWPEKHRKTCSLKVFPVDQHHHCHHSIVLPLLNPYIKLVFKFAPIGVFGK